MVSAASDPTVTSRACADRLLRTEAQVLLRSSLFVLNNHQRDFTSHAPTIILPEIRSPVRKIVCSPSDSVRPVTPSASPSSTILFWATSVPIALLIKAGLSEAHKRGAFFAHHRYSLDDLAYSVNLLLN